MAVRPVNLSLIQLMVRRLKKQMQAENIDADISPQVSEEEASAGSEAKAGDLGEALEDVGQDGLEVAVDGLDLKDGTDGIPITK